jgi:SAM-dependent methyltransferase
VLCGRCGLVFLDPRLATAALARYYRSDTFSREVRGEDRPSPAALAYRDLRARRRWRFLAGALPPTGRCLEVGCGAGNFLALLRDAGHEVVGIDPSTGYARHARERGLDVIAGHFPGDLPRGAPFDVAFAFHVLEHVSDPLAFLAAVRARLRPSGLFALEYPDVALAARRRFLPHSYFERAHLFDFSERTLAAFLARAGFRVGRAWYEERVKPYDRNVLLLCEAAEAAEPPPWDPEGAERLARALRRRLRASAPLMPLRPLWRRMKAALGRRR